MANKGKKNNLSNIRANPNHENSYFIELTVKPNARTNQIFEEFGGDLRIDITDPPQKGKANKAIIKFLGKKLKISTSSIRLVKGHTSSTKIFLIEIENTKLVDLREKLLS
jgi:hypothetical protein